jgi:hypothetical protein
MRARAHARQCSRLPVLACSCARACLERGYVDNRAVYGQAHGGGAQERRVQSKPHRQQRPAHRPAAVRVEQLHTRARAHTHGLCAAVRGPAARHATRAPRGATTQDDRKSETKSSRDGSADGSRCQQSARRRRARSARAVRPAVSVRARVCASVSGCLEEHKHSEGHRRCQPHLRSRHHASHQRHPCRAAHDRQRHLARDERHIAPARRRPAERLHAAGCAGSFGLQ